MTDEEMAEEYKRKHWSDNVTEMNNQYSFQQVKGAPHFYGNAIKQAFLAGLKAGRPQWHDLRKDPNDLPRNYKNVWCAHDDGYDKGFYDKDDNGWWIDGHIFYSTIDAWCEIPTFDKE